MDSSTRIGRCKIHIDILSLSALWQRDTNSVLIYIVGVETDFMSVCGVHDAANVSQELTVNGN